MDTKQKGLRSNTISFPQARCRQLITNALPAEPEKARAYLADTISIVLAGAEPADLDNAAWAQVPAEAYLTAARLFVAHCPAYEAVHLDEKAAREQLRNLVPDVIREQAVRVDVTGSAVTVPDGPATTGQDEHVMSESVVAEAGLPTENDDTGDADISCTPPNVQTPSTPTVPVHFAATDLTTADLDIEAAMKKCRKVCLIAGKWT